MAHVLLVAQLSITMPTNNRRTLIGLLCLFFLTNFTALVVPTAAAADAPAVSLEQRIAKLEAAAAAPGVNSGDNAWMLVSTAMVLLMTAPGLILFYGGLVRSKNVLESLGLNGMREKLSSAVITRAVFKIGFPDDGRGKRVELSGTNRISFKRATHAEDIFRYLRNWAILNA